jgi:GT2 family glycosyltransferase
VPPSAGDVMSVPSVTYADHSVTVVVCAYADRRLALLTDGVSAALRQLIEGDEIVLVIDHNDALLAAVEATFRDAIAAGPLRLVANANAHGLSGARNTGVDRARCDIAAFLDDDAIPQDGWLDALRSPFSDAGVIGVGGVAAAKWETKQPTWFPDEFLWVVGCSYRGLPEQPAEIRNPIGANMAFRTRVVRDAGGFTDGIGRVGRTPLGCEETELAIRASRATGGRILQMPTARVAHVVPDERCRLRYFLHRCWSEGLSKAIVSRMVGSGAALKSERSYVTRTLPAALVRGLRETARGHPAGLQRAAVVTLGLVTTAVGYARGSLARSGP